MGTAYGKQTNEKYGIYIGMGVWMIVGKMQETTVHVLSS